MAKPAPKTKARRVALLGSDTLLGHEIQEVLETRNADALVTGYHSAGEGNFGEKEGEAVYLEPLEANSIKDQEAIILAGLPDGALKAYGLVKAASGHPPLIDCMADLENQPEARIIAPLLGEIQANPGWLLVIAHPAAGALALVLTRLARRKAIQQALAHIFEPASERGQRGLSELQQQTVNLLSFKTLPKDIFDAQLSFNMLSQWGEDAPAKLSSLEQRIERHTATLLGRHPAGAAIPMPSLRLVQAPVFHAYSISLWVQFAENAEAEELGESLASAQIEIRSQQEEAPHNVGAAGQSGLIVGDIRIDRNNHRAAWFWIVADNLRLTADAVSDLLSALDAKHQ